MVRGTLQPVKHIVPQSPLSRCATVVSRQHGQVSTAAPPGFLSGVWLLRSVPLLRYGRRAMQRIAPPSPILTQRPGHQASIQ